MRHANEITAGEVTVGMKFRYMSGDFLNGKYVPRERIATVESVRLTPKGRVVIMLEGVGQWAGAMAASSKLHRN